MATNSIDHHVVLRIGVRDRDKDKDRDSDKDRDRDRIGLGLGIGLGIGIIWFKDEVSTLEGPPPLRRD
jgi:hypothetical protein